MKITKKSKINQPIPQAATAFNPSFPHPDDLLAEAEVETGHSNLKHYANVIAMLRRKGFTFREIARWLTKRGIPTSHNVVYHVFRTCLHPGKVDDIEDELSRQELGED